MDIKVVEFRGEFIALIAEQNEWTGNYIYTMRLVKGGYGMEYIKHYGKTISVKDECARVRANEQFNRLAEVTRKEVQNG